MDYELTGKVALITGSSRGIGFAIAKCLAAYGCKVAICGRNADDVKKAETKISLTGAEVFSRVVDLSQTAAVADIVKSVTDHWGGVDILVNNVGGNRRKPFEETTEADWDDLLAINLRNQITASRAVIPYMKAQQSGSILFISTIYAKEVGAKGLSLYQVTKAAVNSLSKAMAVELAEHGIRVNTVAPGSTRFEGGSWDKRVKADPEGMAEFVKQQIPAGRFGTAPEIAETVAFLASQKASMITGACLNVDGGQSRII